MRWIVPTGNSCGNSPWGRPSMLHRCLPVGACTSRPAMVAPRYRMTRVDKNAVARVTSWPLADQEHRAQAILSGVAGPGLLNGGETLPHNKGLDGVWCGPWAGSRFPKCGCRVPIPCSESGGQDDSIEGVRREQVTVAAPGPHQREVWRLDWSSHWL